MDDRRQYRRYPLSLAVSVSSGARVDCVGVTRDVSAGGALLNLVSRFEPGDAVAIRLALVRGLERIALGRVVRTFRDLEPNHLFRHVCAIQFDAPLTDLEPLVPAQAELVR